MDPEKHQIIKDCKIGANTIVWNFVNLYRCKIGDKCMIGSFTEIQNDVEIGNNVRIQSHTFICSKVKIGNNVFIGHGVMFTNALYPPQGKTKWKDTIVEDNVTIGSNVTLLPVVIGRHSIIGAGSVVTKNVPPNTIVAGNPARILRQIPEKSNHDEAQK